MGCKSDGERRENRQTQARMIGAAQEVGAGAVVSHVQLPLKPGVIPEGFPQEVMARLIMKDSERLSR